MSETKPAAVASTPRWYVVHTYSGYEAKVKASLDERRRGELAKKKGDLAALADLPLERAHAQHREEGRHAAPWALRAVPPKGNSPFGRPCGLMPTPPWCRDSC
jgi:hypothetical protein